MSHVNRGVVALLVLSLLTGLCACGSAPAGNTAATEKSTEATSAPAESAAPVSAEDFAVPKDAVPVDLSQGSYTVTAAGDYVVSGTLTGGQLTVDVPHEKVHLYLNGASVTDDTSAALYVKNAKRVTLILCEGTVNTFSTTGSFEKTDDNNVDAAIFSKGDITVKGTGTLDVACIDGHGIVSKDELKIESGTVNVNAGRHGINGKDSLTILGGTVNVVAGKSALRSNNEEAGFGNVQINGGTLTLCGGTNVIKAVGTVTVSGGYLMGVGGTGSIEGNIAEGSRGTVYTSYENTQNAGCAVTVAKDGGGNVSEFVASGEFHYLLCSVPGMNAGDKYTVSCDGKTDTVSVM